MRNLLAILLAASVAALSANSANACMADGPEGYVSGLIWETKHTNVPTNAVVLEVEVVEQENETQTWLVVNILSGPDDFVGKRINILPERWSSCVGLGRLKGFIVIRRQAFEREDAPNVKIFAALDYLPGPADRSSGMRREKNWFVPGDPAPDPFKDLRK